MASEDRFGYEWSTYKELNPLYEAQLKQWLGPITQDFIKGKKILDAGCGMGRNSYWCLQWGASEIVAFDNDDRTVQIAKETLSPYSNAQVEKQSIYSLPYKNEFDFVFSIGVIQLLENPKQAVSMLYRALKPGGTMLLWLYAKEGNDFVLRYLDPLRRHLTSKLPPALLDPMTYFLSIPLYLYLHVLRPKDQYYHILRQLPFRNVHLILFDHLLPRVAHYFTQEESLALLEGLEHTQAMYINNNSWTVTGIKPK